MDLDGTAHSINHTGELGQQIIAGRIDHPATVVLDQGGDHCTVGGEGADGGFFIFSHEAAVARDVSAKDSSQLAFHARAFLPASLPWSSG